MSEFSHVLGSNPQTGAIPQVVVDWLAENLPDSGTSGTSNLLVVSGSVTLDDGVDVGTLVGYRATASTTFTGQGGAVTLAAGAYIFERVAGGWTYRTIDEGTGLTPLAPDTTNPTAGTLAVTGVTHNAATLTVTGASDNQALHGAPYAFSTNNGSTWTNYQTSNVYAATGLTPSTSYQFRHRVRDASGNVSTGTAVTQSTTAAPALAADDFNRADGPLGTSSSGHVWKTIAGSPVVASNRARGNGSLSRAVIDVGQSNQKVSATLITNTYAVGLILRSNAAIDLFYRVIYLSNQLHIVYNGASTVALDVWTPTVPPPGKVLAVSAVTSGADVIFTVWINGALERTFTLTDPAYVINGTHAGIWTVSTGSAGNGEFDNFKVESA